MKMKIMKMKPFKIPGGLGLNIDSLSIEKIPSSGTGEVREAIRGDGEIPGIPNGGLKNRPTCEDIKAENIASGGCGGEPVPTLVTPLSMSTLPGRPPKRIADIMKALFGADA